MRIDKPLWHEALILTRQHFRLHFQQLARWTDFTLRQLANAALHATNPARSCQICLPISVPDVSSELYAVPRS